MVSAQLCPLGASPGTTCIDFLLFLKRLCAPWNPPWSLSSPRRILNADFCFNQHTGVTLLLAKRKKHEKHKGNNAKPIANVPCTNVPPNAPNQISRNSNVRKLKSSKSIKSQSQNMTIITKSHENQANVDIRHSRTPPRFPKRQAPPLYKLLHPRQTLLK